MNMPQSFLEEAGGLVHQLWSIKDESVSQEALTSKHFHPIPYLQRETKHFHLEALRGKHDGLRWDIDSFCYNPQELPQPRLKGKCKMFTTALTRIAKLNT